MIMKKKIKLKVALVERGLTVKALSEKANVKYWSLCSFISGRWNLSPEEMERVAHAIGAPAEDLFKE